jgi:hypothetical protein
MRKLLVLGVVLMFAAGCGASSAPPDAVAPPADAPVAPVGPDGQPITTLCDLLSPQDITEVTGLPAAKPDAPPSMTSANCVYGTNLRLSIVAVDSIDAANTSYWGAMKEFTTVIKQKPIGGVDESVYAMGNDFSGLGLRRQKLVVTIVLPGAPDQAEIKLIQLAGRLLSRAHALGT